MVPLLLAQFGADVEAALDYMRAHLDADEALVAGRLDEARSGFSRCRELAPLSSTIAYALACVAARAGDLERAFAALEDARRLGFRDAALAEWDPDLAQLRDEPRFRSLMKAIREDIDTRLARTFLWIVPEPDGSQSRRTLYAETSVPGACIIAGDSRGGLERLEPHTGRLLCDYEPVDGPVWRIAVHPSRPEFAVLTTQGELAFFRCDAAAPFLRARAFPREPQGPQFPFDASLEYSPDGARLAVRCIDRGASVWSSSGHPLFVVADDDLHARDCELAWTADGQALARRVGPCLWLLDASTGAPLTVLDTPSRIECATFDPTGLRLATGHEDSRLRLWDARDLSLVAEVEIGPGFLDAPRQVNTVAFSLDGSRLVFAGCESIEIFVLDANSGERVYSDDAGYGHFCEPLGLFVDDDATHVWFANGCGENPLSLASRDPPEVWLPLVGRAPTANPTGLVAVAGPRGISGFDFRRRRILWFRPTLEGEELLQTRSSHFGSIPNAIARLAFESSRPEKSRTALANRVHDLFDPKRVRASLAGVELALWP